MRAFHYYLLALAALTIYGGQVCPLLDGLPVWNLGLLLLAPVGLAFLLRSALQGRVVLALPPQIQSRRQFVLDLSLFIGAGLFSALFNKVVVDFPFAVSGLKLTLGFTALGLIAAVDLSLERERSVIAQALEQDAGRLPPKRFYPLTRKFTLVGTAVLVLCAGIIVLIFSKDIAWLAGEGVSRENVRHVQQSVILEVAFVMGTLVTLIVNLIFSYSKNLRLLFTNQTTVLERVSQGDMEPRVPVMTNDEFGFIAGHTNSMIDGLRDRMRMLEGLQVAQEIQHTLLPKTPDRPDLDVAGSSSYSDETGGDYYDFMNACGLDGDCLGVVVGDVTGHGVGAALLMASTRAFLRLRVTQPGDPARYISEVNELITSDTFGTGRFITLFFLVMNGLDQSLTWVSAGHDPAITYDPATESFSELRGSDIPLGIQPGWPYAMHRRGPLARKEVVLIGTDGLWETENPGGEMFGKERVRELLKRHADQPAKEIVRDVIEAVAQWRGSSPQEDDVTLVVVKRV